MSLHFYKALAVVKKLRHFTDRAVPGRSYLTAIKGASSLQRLDAPLLLSNCKIVPTHGHMQVNS